MFYKICWINLESFTKSNLAVQSVSHGPQMLSLVPSFTEIEESIKLKKIIGPESTLYRGEENSIQLATRRQLQ